jgi:hypothetical protein
MNSQKWRHVDKLGSSILLSFSCCSCVVHLYVFQTEPFKETFNIKHLEMRFPVKLLCQMPTIMGEFQVLTLDNSKLDKR